MANDFVKVSLKGVDFTFTALDFEQLQTLEGDFAALTGMGEGLPTAEQRNAIVNIVSASVHTRHPEVSREEVARLLTLANIGTAMKAVAGVSGLVAADQGNA